MYLVNKIFERTSLTEWFQYNYNSLIRDIINVSDFMYIRMLERKREDVFSDIS